jgi:SAM-dependent methyltransferase
MDTLSWARLGAKVTGVDFSHKAISLARNLSAELEIPARFIESNLYDLPRVLKGKYDIVFTSYGVLCWLPDLTRWAQIAAGYLKRGGTFYIVEGHPVMNILDTAPDSAGNPVSKVTYPYFSSSPTEWPPGNDYADQGFRTRTGSVEWNHPLSEIINALIGAGLRIEFLHEFPVCCYQASPYLHQDPQGWWRMPGDLLPQTFSIKATKR